MLIIFTLSCTSKQRNDSIKYKRTNRTTSVLSNSKYTMNIPIGSKLINLVGGHNEIEKQFVYSDSSKLYISDFECSMLNYKNILSLGDSIALKRFEGVEIKAKIAKELNQKFKPETITLQGKTVNGFWKDIRIGYICVGYVNVPENHKKKFDEALGSLKKK